MEDYESLRGVYQINKTKNWKSNSKSSFGDIVYNNY